MKVLSSLKSAKARHRDCKIVRRRRLEASGWKPRGRDTAKLSTESLRSIPCPSLSSGPTCRTTRG